MSLDKNALLNKINRLYSVQVNCLQYADGGFSDRNFVLLSTNQQRFFLKEYSLKNRDRIGEIHEARRFFYQGGVPVVLPIDTRNRDSFFFSSDSFYALFPYISDKILKGHQLSIKAAVSMGKVLSRIHLLGKRADMSFETKLELWDSSNAFEEASLILNKIKSRRDRDSFDQIAIENIEFKQTRMKSNKKNFSSLSLDRDHLVHGDYLYHNIFFNTSNEVTYVFDFEKTCYSPRSYELVRSMIYNFFNNSKEAPDYDKTKAFLNSYCEQYPISKDEVIAGLELFHLKLIHSFWVEKEYYFNENSLVKPLLESENKILLFLSKSINEYKKVIFF